MRKCPALPTLPQSNVGLLPTLTDRRGVQSARDVNPCPAKHWTGPSSARKKRIDASSDKTRTPVLPVGPTVSDVVSGPPWEEWGPQIAGLSAVALQTWDDTDQKTLEMENIEYGSPLVACEAKLRELQHMAFGVEQPNPTTVSIAYDLLQRVFQTLTPRMQRSVMPLMTPLGQSIFMGSPSESHSTPVPDGKSTIKASVSPVIRSDSRAHPTASSATLRASPALSTLVDSPRPKREKRMPYFVLARQQHSALEQKTRAVACVNIQVEGQLQARSNALSVTYRLQAQSRLMTMYWLMSFWRAYLRNKHNQRHRVQNLLGGETCPVEQCTGPFMNWRLYTIRRRLKMVKKARQDLDRDGRKIANQITRLQIESEALYSKSIGLHAQQAEINKRLRIEKEGHGELLERWQTMHPELLNKVLVQALGFYFGFMARTAQFHNFETRRKLRQQCFAELLPAAAETPGSMHSGVRCEDLFHADAEDLLRNWINYAIRRVKLMAEEQLKQVLAGGSELEKKDKERCEGIINMEEIQNLDDDLHDGNALVCLFAVLRASTFSYELTCHDLLLLDERVPDIRVGQLCFSAHCLLPQDIAKKLFRADKITNGTEEVLATMLAALFFSETGLPKQPMAVLDLEDDSVKNNENVESHSGTDSSKDTEALKSSPDTTKEGDKDVGDGNEDEKTVTKPSEGESLNDTDGEKASTTNLDSSTFQTCGSEHAMDPVEELMKTMAACGQPFIDDPLQDPTPLLHGGEVFHDLATIPLEQMLLRWVNFQLQGSEFHKPVENFGSDLQDGVAFSLLLEEVAPESVPTKKMPAEVDERLEMIVAVGQRVTDFELLTVGAIIEGQSDVLAAFLCTLFLCRPNLQVRQESLLAMHLKLLDNVLNSGSSALDTRGKPSPGAVTKLCVHLESSSHGLHLALAAVQDTQVAMTTLKDRVQMFYGEALAQRARGQPRSMLDAKESRDFLLYTTLNPDRAKQVFFKDTGDDALAIRERVEDVLRKNFRLLREMYQGYSTRENGKGLGITLEGIMKIYQECKLRTRDFAPHHVESIFYDVTDSAQGSQDSASPESFVEVLLHIAKDKYSSLYDNLPEQVVALFELNLAPHACQDSESFFQKIAYEPKVREVLRKHTEELRMVFRVYAALDVSSAEALSKVSTMNVSEFRMLLEHCDLLDAVLTTEVVSRIFEGIQQSEDFADTMADDDEDREGVDDDDELAFSEFLDGLIAIAAYKQPNPFVPFSQRVDMCLVDIFSALRRYWSRNRQSAPVIQMLNALQKKVKGHEGEDGRKTKGRTTNPKNRPTAKDERKTEKTKPGSPESSNQP